MTAGPNARAVLRLARYSWTYRFFTNLTAPPVKGTDHSMTMNKVNPKPSGARGVRLCFSGESVGSSTDIYMVD